MTAKNNTETKTETKTEVEPAWDSDIKMESVQKSLKAGIILPQFKPYANTVYEIEFISEPRWIDNEKGKFHRINIKKGGMKYSMSMNASLKFGIKVLQEFAKLKTFKDLLGIPFKVCKNDDGFYSIQTL